MDSYDRMCLYVYLLASHMTATEQTLNTLLRAVNTHAKEIEGACTAREWALVCLLRISLGMLFSACSVFKAFLRDEAIVNMKIWGKQVAHRKNPQVALKHGKAKAH